MSQALEKLYAARRAALEAEATVLDADSDADLVPMLAKAIEEARGRPERHEQSFRLQVLADLLPKVQDPGALALLLNIMNEADDSVRARAAMAFAGAAPTRFPEIVRVVQDALDGGFEGPALLELPGLLLDSPGSEYAPPIDILVGLIEHDDPEVVAEAACALAEIDVPGVRELLESLQEDGRVLSDPAGETTLGELVTDLLSAMALGEAMDPATPHGEA